MHTPRWDDRAADIFAEHRLDVERGFEIKDPGANIRSMDELLNA